MDYTQTPDQVGVGVSGDGLDMDMVHDFGEGVGLDMRDFPVHDVDDGLEDNKHMGEFEWVSERDSIVCCWPRGCS